jgi:hypothetical protein
MSQITSLNSPLWEKMFIVVLRNSVEMLRHSLSEKIIVTFLLEKVLS